MAAEFRQRDNERLRKKYRSDREWRERKLLAWRLREPWDKTVTAESVAARLERQHGLCPYCRKDIRDDYHMDHVMPLSKGGRSTLANLQLTCSSCNHRKSDKAP